MLNLLHHCKCFFGTSREESEGKIEQKKDFGLLMILKGNAAEEKIFSKKITWLITEGNKTARRNFWFRPERDQVWKVKRVLI